ncbi:MAG: response regulator, partial [Magnetococcales bacterium]|nr:response regulator [Magnetococcales bacterium]
MTHHRELDKEKVFTILLVDDQPEQIDVIKSALQPHYVLKIATNGPVALKIAEAGGLDLVLLDVVMPGMDGYEVCQRLQEMSQSEKTPIIFLTMMDGQDDEAMGLEQGAVDFIRKPSCPSVVLTRVRNAIAHEQTKKGLIRK